MLTGALGLHSGMVPPFRLPNPKSSARADVYYISLSSILVQLSDVIRESNIWQLTCAEMLRIPTYLVCKLHEILDQ